MVLFITQILIRKRGRNFTLRHRREHQRNLRRQNSKCPPQNSILHVCRELQSMFSRYCPAGPIASPQNWVEPRGRNEVREKEKDQRCEPPREGRFLLESAQQL